MDTTMPLAHDRAAFTRLLQDHQGIVATVAASYCRDPDDRADLAQEIAVQLWRAWPKYEPAKAFSTWMYRIALNVKPLSTPRGVSADPFSRPKSNTVRR